MEPFKCLAKRVRKDSPPEKCEVVDAHASPDWVKQWSDVYWADDVKTEIHKARLWTLDNAESCPSKLPTARYLRSFLGNWIRRDCRIKPQMRVRVEMDDEPKPEVKKEIRVDYLKQMKERLAR